MILLLGIIESKKWDALILISKSIFKKRVISFITVFSFECEKIVVSDDLDIPENDFDKATWKKLKSFFRRHGIKYGY